MVARYMKQATVNDAVSKSVETLQLEPAAITNHSFM